MKIKSLENFPQFNFKWPKQLMTSLHLVGCLDRSPTHQSVRVFLHAFEDMIQSVGRSDSQLDSFDIFLPLKNNLMTNYSI